MFLSADLTEFALLVACPTSLDEGWSLEFMPIDE